MRQKLFKKYFFTIGVIIVVSLTMMMLVMTVVYNNQLSAQTQKSLKNSCDKIYEYLDGKPLKLGDTAAEKQTHEMLNTLSDVVMTDVYYTDSKGVIKICYCDDWGEDGICEHSGTELSGAFIDKSDYSGASSLGMYTDRQYVLSRALKDQSGNISAYIISTSEIPSFKFQLEALWRIYIFSALVPILIMLAVIYIITYRLTKPLKMMSQAARAMSRGDFSRRIPVTSDDEIGELAVAFNQMTNSLSRLEGMRKSFVADVSHELKTPMTTIGGFIDGILDGTIEKEKQKYYLEIASDEVKRLSRMVESMLSLSRIESEEFVFKPEKFDFKELLINVVISQEQLIEQKNLEIEGLDGIDNIIIKADKDLIHRVVYNLVDNAIKFCDQKGKISFEVLNDLKSMSFSIKNTGSGIPKAELPYIFERFYKIDKSRSANKKSTGLGLYIVKTIIKKHSGTITVHSKENEYTAFTVTLPLLK